MAPEGLPGLERGALVAEFNKRRRIFRVAAAVWGAAGMPILVLENLPWTLTWVAALAVHERALWAAAVAASAAMALVALFVSRCPSCHRYIGSLDGGARCDFEKESARWLDQPKRRLYWLRRFEG